MWLETDEEICRFLLDQVDALRPPRHGVRDLAGGDGGLWWLMSPEWRYAILRLASPSGRPVAEPAFTPLGLDFLYGIPVIVRPEFGAPVLSESRDVPPRLAVRVLGAVELAS